MLACVGFVPAIFFPHIGEEGVYTISSLEMLYNHDFLQVTLYGGNYPRPPLYNWCILGVAYILHIKDLLIAARIVSILSTLATSAIVACLAKRLWKQPYIGLLTSCIFLSGDTLIRRGWLAYSDPIFALFVFASIALLWLAVHELCLVWLLLSAVCVILGFLAKVHTVYIFYGVAWLILMWRYSSNWKFLFSVKAIVIYFLIMFFPWFWTKYIACSGTIASTVDNTINLFKLDSLISYVVKICWYPFYIIWRMFPISALVVWHVFWKKNKVIVNDIFFIAGLIIAINILPYWIAPSSSVRYLQPLYPLFAMMFAYIIYSGGELLLKKTIVWLIVCIGINYIVMFVWYPYDQAVYKGNARTIAQEIIQLVQDEPLYINDSGAGGLRIAAELNSLRANKPPLRAIGGDYRGFVVVHNPADITGKLIATYKLGGITVYLKGNGIYH